ncbi:vacuolar protein sorting-associated, partial [Nannochloropsis gaditana CCMP526]|uniref:vacuolar protein sorting-associated n=1 Tax=Nannochloropsis gaditana (strain CCMP526) TaxID=1093141 RepID=UPI00029F6FF3
LFNVYLKEDVLDTLGLPLTLRFGRIGHVEVQIPWNQLGRKAVIVKLEQVHVLVYAKYQWEDEANERRLEAIKQAQLRVAEEKAEE